MRRLATRPSEICGLAIAACPLACADLRPTALPLCAATQERPLPESSCELDRDVADYKRDTVLTLWSYVGSSSSRLPIVLGFDARARVESVCVEQGVSLGGRARAQLERAIRTLRAVAAPACLAETRLALGEDFAAASRAWRRKERRLPEVEEFCGLAERRCLGLREPVCALLSDGSRETYPDACQACRDPAVTGYDAGSCPFLP